MRHLLAVWSRARGALIYTALCLGLLLLVRERAWQHVSTLNGDEWLPVQSYVRANRSGQEPICFLPSWTAGHATDLYKFRGFEVLERPEDAWEGRAAPVPGLWVVSQFGVFDPADVPRDLYPHRGSVTIGGVEVFVFRREAFPALPVTLAQRIREAKCILHGPGRKATELVWSRTGYVIPRGFPNREGFSYLGCRAEEARAGGRDHFGVWFHPPPAGYSLEVVWPRIELQPWVAVSGGLRDAIAARRGPDTELSVKVDGAVVETLRFPSKRGWSTFPVELAAKAGGGPVATRVGSLGFEVRTKNNRSRHFVFDARLESVRPEVPEPPESAEPTIVPPGDGAPDGAPRAGVGPDAAAEGGVEPDGPVEVRGVEVTRSGTDARPRPRIPSAPGPRPRSSR